jgi:ABC-type sugar transport system ATPase subunit
VLGIRPQDIEVVGPSKRAENSEETYPAIVDLVEPAGAETTLHLQTGAHTLICCTRAAADDHPSGRRVRFLFDAAKAHLFDPASSERIS